MNLPPLPAADDLHMRALDYRSTIVAPAEAFAALEHYVRTYAEQYGRLCAEAEREACAKLADEIAEKHLNSGHYISIVGDRAVRAGGQVDGAKESARAIRARGQR